MTQTTLPKPFDLGDALQAYLALYLEEATVVEEFRSVPSNRTRCSERDHFSPGHITGSAWLMDESGEYVLLTHHRTLAAWLQLGGHSDGDPDTAAVAKREAGEESGLAVELLSREILDIDVHEIPARADRAHFNFDVRFAFVSRPGGNYVVSDESHDLAWLLVDGMQGFTTEESMLRMARKWTELRARIMACESAEPGQRQFRAGNPR
ncbi:MAG: NUDIX hydrolase [Xanthomonadaceae bacterium]|nr:NUDIX hydrolase [Xanthomonadaceae bacterium]